MYLLRIVAKDNKKEACAMARSRLPRGVDIHGGMYRSRFTINGKRYEVSAVTLKLMTEKERQKRQEIEEGSYKNKDNVRVSEYLERWLGMREGTAKETTLRNNRIFCNMIKGTVIDKTGAQFGNLKMREVEVQNVRDLQCALADGHSTRTTNDVIALLKMIFKYAMEADRIIAFNPAAPVKALKRTEPPARDTIHRALSKDEIAAFMEHIGDSAYRNLYIFLMSTGCRIGEAGALQLRDINKNNTIRICRTITRTESGGYKIGDETKTAAGRRMIPLTEEAAAAIERQRAFNAALYGTKDDLTDTIFKAERGGLLKAAPVNADIKRICKAAGIDYFSVHAMRDTFATRCVESGMQPKTLQEIMGHSDIAMTMNLYAHVMPETKVEQMQAVNFF